MAGAVASRRRRDPTSRWQHVDGVLVAATVSLALLGCLMVYSATRHGLAQRSVDPLSSVRRQGAFVVLGLIVMGVVAAVDLRRLRRLAALPYLGAVGLLVVVLSPLGTEVNGARSWFAAGSFQLQPAELAKLATIVAVAGACARRRGGLDGRGLVVTLGLAAVPMGLVLLQPDLGSALVFAVVTMAMLLVAGARALHLVGLVALAVGGAVGVLQLDLLEGYQRDRLTAFADGGSSDRQGVGFQLDQSMTTVAAGGLAGAGLFEGTQTKLGFVPEQQTDFIFTVAGEELGLVGAGLIILLMGVLLWRALSIAAQADDLFGRLAAAGIACWFGFQSFQNIGMCLGIMPVTGVPLPLVSYGGTSMFATLMAVGLLQNIHLRSQGSFGLGVNRTRLVRSRF